MEQRDQQDVQVVREALLAMDPGISTRVPLTMDFRITVKCVFLSVLNA